MSETTQTDELETTVRNALDAAEEPNSPYWDLPNTSTTTDEDGNVTVHALEKRRNKRNVHRKQRDALDAAGVEWHFKEDGRFSDGVNRRKVVVTGFVDDEDDEEETVELVTDGGVDEDDLWTTEFSHTPAVGIPVPAHVPENLRDELERVFSEIEEFADGRRRTKQAGTVRFEFDREASEWTFHSVEIRDYARRTAYSNDDVQARAEQAVAAVQSRDEDEDDEEETVELDAENAHEKPVSATESVGKTFGVRIEEEFADGSTHTDHYTAGQAWNVLVGLREILNDEEGETVELDPDDVHEKPVRVRETSGTTYAVVVEEEFGDGSTHTDHYTETQARKLLSDLQAILSDDEEIRPDGGDEEDSPVVLPDGGQVQPADDDEDYPADRTEVHGVQENTSGISGLCVLYSVHGLHYRVRLRPVNPLDCETFDRGDAWTVYEWAEVETPEEDAPSVSFEEIHYVPAVVREQIPGPVQVPDRPGHVEGGQ